jgi:hypothetical protein
MIEDFTAKQKRSGCIIKARVRRLNERPRKETGTLGEVRLSSNNRFRLLAGNAHATRFVKEN